MDSLFSLKIQQNNFLKTGHKNEQKCSASNVSRVCYVISQFTGVKILVWDVVFEK